MTIVSAPPVDINDCGILRLLRNRSTERDGVAAKVQQFIAIATPMVDLVAAGPFRHYTLHNRDHAKKLLHLVDHLITEEALGRLSLLECLTMVYAAFLHDMGMAVTSMERNRILESSEFQETVREWPELASSIRQARSRLETVSEEEKPLIEGMIHQFHEAALSAYLRPRHATLQRYRQLIDHLKQAGNAPDLFCIRGVSFEECLIDVCASHNLDAAALSESVNAYEDRFPRDLTIAQDRLNIQYCAALLRLTDILDFDRERTPRILFESLGISSSALPGAELSLREWEKHMAIHTIDVRADEIVISAECHHPAIEKAIREFCSLIEREIRDTMAILKRNPPDVVRQYTLELPLSVRPRINSIGYSYKDLSLRLNQSAIISLLMGDRLYSHSGVALRELIQNSLDACEVRRRLEHTGNYAAEIEVLSKVDSLGRIWIEVSDNGIGMDEHVLSEYFLKLGDSYYDSNEFKRQFAKLQIGHGPFRPVSRFGIGILSVFMLADVLEVQTRSAFSPRRDKRGHFIRVERLGGLAFVAESDRAAAGTTIRIRMRPEIASRYDAFVRAATGYLRWLLLRPWFRIRVALGENDLRFSAPTAMGAFYSLSAEGKAYLVQNGYEPVVVELERWSDRLSGIAIIVLARDKEGRLTNIKDGRQITLLDTGQSAVNPYSLVREYKGNRLTINGFHVMTFRTKGLLRFPTGLRFVCIVDMDAAGGDGVEFDVSRERLTKKGEQYLREEFRTAIVTAFTETGVMDQLANDIRLSIPVIPLNDDEVRDRLANRLERPDALQDLFRSVVDAIPNGPWPRGLHSLIASRLHISSKLVSKVLQRLLESGVISKPNE
jgi:signal transduction histidine kinase